MSANYAAGDPAPEPLALRSEAEITARWASDEPLVSVLCPTYQHAGFIENAIRGFLGQETSFSFEVLVRDDASTDGTAEIVQGFAERYPRIVRAVLEEMNTWSSRKPLEVLLPLVRGRFLTICEGDDYWVDPHHLARSVARLQSDPSLAAVVSPCWTASGAVLTGIESPDPHLRWNYYLPIRSLIFRRETEVPWNISAAGDMVLALALQQHGPILTLDVEPPVIHVQHGGGIHAGLSYAEKKLANIEQLLRIAIHLAEGGEQLLAEQYRDYAAIKVRKVLRDYVDPSSDGKPSSGFKRRFRGLSVFR
jgi:glycosyltransferase involved in cell wall biosynthesis